MLRKNVEELQDKAKDNEELLAVQTMAAEDFKKKFENERTKSERYVFQWKQAESSKDYMEGQLRKLQGLEEEMKKFKL
jgi:hypothetical protein